MVLITLNPIDFVTARSMKAIDQYLVPYLASQVISLLILISAIKSIRLARLLFSFMFLYAGVYNMHLGLTRPDEYLEFATLAITPYRNFILGWFSEHNKIMILLIAAGQLTISAFMIMKNTMVRLACLGSIVFLVAIAPLGVGSAFPFSITASIAAYLIMRGTQLDFLWNSRSIRSV